MREEPRGVHRFFTLLWLLLVELVFTVAAGAVCVAALFVKKGVCDSDVTMEGKTVIVTGSNAGIGKATAKELARRKARVILACRNLDKAKRAALEILEETQQEVVVKHLDLASFKSVRKFADDIIKSEARLDVLINNAGVVLGSKKVELTEDGYELGFQSNYLSHVLLTMLLADLLKKSAPSRVVNVSSILHHLGKTDKLEDRARGEHPFRNPLAVYCNTKLAQLFFTKALSERLKDSGVTVNAVHPGNVKTEIAEQSPGSGFFKLLLDIAGKVSTIPKFQPITTRVMVQREAGGLFEILLPVWRTLKEWWFLVATGTLCVVSLFARKGVYKSRANMEGKTVIVTGGSSGMGKEIAKDLARRKARVIIAVCDLDQAKEASHEIFEYTRQTVLVKYLDLASFKSVREFAADIVRTVDRLDVLVNNAGVVLDSSEVKLTEDGYEKAFQTNYLGHFLLTMLLLDLLKKTAPSRIVNVSSALHHLGSTDNLEDRAKGKNPSKHPVAIYCNTKLAMLLFTRALAYKLKPNGVTVNTLHPGVVNTGIVSKASGLVATFFSLVQNIGGKTPQQGAKTSIFLAVDPKVQRITGKYFDNCKPTWVSRKAANRKRSEQLFRSSLKLVGFEDKTL